MSLRHTDEQIELEMKGGALIAVGRIARLIWEICR
jgi:hypothetical protein